MKEKKITLNNYWILPFKWVVCVWSLFPSTKSSNVSSEFGNVVEWESVDFFFCDSNCSFRFATIDNTFRVGRGGGGGGPLCSSLLSIAPLPIALPLRALTLLKFARAAFISSWAFSKRRMLVSMSDTGDIWVSCVCVVFSISSPRRSVVRIDSAVSMDRFAVRMISSKESSQTSFCTSDESVDDDEKSFFCSTQYRLFVRRANGWIELCVGVRDFSTFNASTDCSSTLLLFHGEMKMGWSTFGQFGEVSIRPSGTSCWQEPEKRFKDLLLNLLQYKTRKEHHLNLGVNANKL